MSLTTIHSEPERNEQVPLLFAYLKKNPHLREYPFLITHVKESRNGEWLLVNHYKLCCVLVNVKSLQYEQVMETLEQSHHNGYASYFRYSTKTKSNAEFLIDDEVPCLCSTSEDGMTWRIKSALNHIPLPSPDPSIADAPAPEPAPPAKRQRKKPVSGS